jgi:uncharacterized phage protein gp47/JayE
MAKVDLIDFETREVTLRRILGRGRSAQLPGLLVGQTFRGMATIFSDELQGFNYRLNTAIANGLPTTSSGPYLDMMGESLFGMQRQAAVSAFAQASDQNVMFYTETGSLFDYVEKIGDGRGRIPSGAIITDQAGNDYSIVADVYVLPGDTKVYASVEATYPGRSKNLPANALRFHSMDARIKVTNLYDISTGQDLESDNNYRFRIMQAHLASQGGNRAALSKTLAEVPGISRFLITENVNGPGTVEILLLPTGNKVPPAVLEVARNAAQSIAPAGSIVSVREPDYVEFELTLKVSLRGGSAYYGPAIEQAARSATLTYMSTVGLGGSLNTNALRTNVLNSISTYQPVSVDILCMALNNMASPFGTIRLGRRELLVPSSQSPDPVRVITV